MIFTVHVVGDRTTDSDKARSRCCRKEPSLGDDVIEDVREQDAGFAFQTTLPGVERDEPV
jgi:hypothetical protein